MADTVAEVKDATKASPEKQKEEKKVEAVDEDSKTSENGDDKPRENGTSDDASEESKDTEPESTENGDVAASPVASAKRKSGAGDAPELTPEKKAKVDDKAKADKVDSAEANGEAEATA
ncbi:serrate RNA effector molecule homolog B-like [Bacillus rossius redtenbacheri]|uniref:serrate RNA effector molecule homolog B-like n=1 Tax=Bacillus rossius redtenbacheri TaxID=93214 RepID=UPI002FDD695A